MKKRTLGKDLKVHRSYSGLEEAGKDQGESLRGGHHPHGRRGRCHR